MIIISPFLFTQKYNRAFKIQYTSKLEAFLPLSLSHIILVLLCHKHEMNKHLLCSYAKWFHISKIKCLYWKIIILQCHLKEGIVLVFYKIYWFRSNRIPNLLTRALTHPTLQGWWPTPTVQSLWKLKKIWTATFSSFPLLAKVSKILQLSFYLLPLFLV